MSDLSTNFDSVMAKLGITKAAASSTTTAKSNVLDQTAFLKLMTEQLKNQDPFAPVDNTQMVAQMAQMSSVSGIAEMNTTLKDISSRLGSSSVADALGYVGKTVLVDGAVAYPSTDGSLTAQTALDADSIDVTVTVSDASGNVLRTLSLGPQSKGTVAIDWDGKTDAGAAAGNGPFTLKASAQMPSGTLALTTQVWAPVTSVNLPSDGSPPTLAVAGLGTVSTSAVHQVA